MFSTSTFKPLKDKSESNLNLSEGKSDLSPKFFEGQVQGKYQVFAKKVNVKFYFFFFLGENPGEVSNVLPSSLSAQDQIKFQVFIEWS